MALDRLLAAAERAVDEYYKRCRTAEQHRDEEVHAAVVLQSCWRGVLQRSELKRLSHVALTIQRCWRGYLGRQQFAAALKDRNRELREAYFNHRATIIQKCWRGYFSRSRIHDFYKRKAYLAAVAAANAAVRAGMAAEMQDALTHQQQQAEQLAKQHFDAQVSRLHHLASTACTPGIFSPPATAAGVMRESTAVAVAGKPLEHHLKTASKQQAASIVKQQQDAIRQTINGCSLSSSSKPVVYFPAGFTASKAAAGSTGAAAVGRPSSAVSVPGSTLCAYSSGSTTAHLKGVQRAGKLSSTVVSAVDEWFAGHAEPNMPDGSFNAALTLQQSTEYEAERQAAELEGRISRGLMLNLHNGLPFNSITRPCVEVQQPGSPKDVAAAGAGTGAAATVAPLTGTCRAQQPSSHATASARTPAALRRTGGSPNPGITSKPHHHSGQPAGSPQQHWQHNKHAGAFLNKHLKQAY